jgi:hypothetical protein
MQEFSDLENLQFVKNTKFSKFSNLAGIGEPMVPDLDMAGCFRKYLPHSLYASFASLSLYTTFFSIFHHNFIILLASIEIWESIGFEKCDKVQRGGTDGVH